MDLNQYGEGCRNLESIVSLLVTRYPSGEDEFTNARLMHAIMGISTEAGEMMDVLKKHIFYGKPLDRDAMLNLLEEAGDVCYYLFGILLDELGDCLGLDDPIHSCLAGNLAKLKRRYGEEFSEFAATHRDVAAEMEALQQELS